MIIPKIIHQTWRDTRIPEAFVKFVHSWQINHPSWQYCLWTDEDNRRLISEDFPWFLDTYDSYPSSIQRADAVRYFILSKYGGVYADLDVLSCKSIQPLLAGENCVLGLEPKGHADKFNLPKILGNAVMAAVPDHGFLAEVTSRLKEFSMQKEGDSQFVLNTTGPFMLTKVYDDFLEKASVTLLPSDVFCPMTAEQAKMERSKGVVQVDLSSAYTIHYFWGSWWSPTRFRELVERQSKP